jgi:hypothetical protein
MYDTTPTVLTPPAETLYYANYATSGSYAIKSGITNDFDNNYSSVASAFGWFSNARDMLSYLMALRNGDVMDLAVLDELFSTEAGFFDVETDAGTGYWHNGAWGHDFWESNKKYTAGVSTVVMHLPEEIDVVLLINTLNNDAKTNATAAFNQWFANEGFEIIFIPPGDGFVPLP